MSWVVSQSTQHPCLKFKINFVVREEVFMKDKPLNTANLSKHLVENLKLTTVSLTPFLLKVVATFIFYEQRTSIFH